MSYYTPTPTAYYTNPEVSNTKQIQNINDMLTSNAPFNEIQTLINNLGSESNLIMNGYDTCGCAGLLQLLQTEMNIIIELEKKIPSNRFNLVKPFDTNIKTVLKTDYVKYILKYGVPDDGVFLPELLAEFQ